MRRLLTVLLLLASPPALAQIQREPVVGLPCEGCEAVFDGMPGKNDSHARIAPTTEPGVPMKVSGTVFGTDGRPRAGIVIYAYQTNRDGIYPQSAVVRDPETRRQGSLRSWARTDAGGRYAFDTIRPGSYPAQDVPEHIHMHVLEPGCATYYVDDIMFTDDPKLTPVQIRRIARNRGGNGISTPVLRAGTWQVQRDIHLGENIPGYRDCRSMPRAR